MSVVHFFLESKDVEGVKAAARCLEVSQHLSRLDIRIEELGVAKVADVGFRDDRLDEVADCPLRLNEELIVLEFCLVDCLFLGSDGVFCALRDGCIVDSRLLLSGEGCFVVSEVRHFVLYEADKVMYTCFVVVGDLGEGFRRPGCRCEEQGQKNDVS